MNKDKIPDFFHIGIMKTGTTSIQNTLGKDKRIQLFLHSRIINTNQYYFKKYESLDYSKITIESDENIYRSMGNMYGLNTSLKRIQHANPNAIIIVTIREQRSLLISAYKHLIRRTTFNKSFADFLKCSEGVSFLNALNYYKFYLEILNYFPANQVRFILYENDLINSFYEHGIGLKAPKNIIYPLLNKTENDTITAFNLKLNKLRLFRKDVFFSKIEDYFYSMVLKFFSRFNKNSKQKLFFWDKRNPFLNEIEKEFSVSNKLFSQETGLNIKEFNYLT